MRSTKTRAALVAALLITAAAPAAAQIPALGPDGGWLQHADASEAGFSRVALDEARAKADSLGSAAVLVVTDGRVVAAWGDLDRPFEAYSVRKSLVSALYGIAVERDLVELDVTLADLGIDDREGLTDIERSARVADLLAARSGVYHPAAYSPSGMEAGLPARGSHAPGTYWYYNNWDFNVAGVILERETGLPVRQAFGAWIADPIGMEDYDPEDGYDAYEPSKSIHPAQTFRISARDLARLGQLYLEDGRWNGEQIVPASWIERSTRVVSDIGGGQGYGLMWWVYPAGTLPADVYSEVWRYDVIQARGSGGQALFVIPGADLVVVHRSDHERGRSVDGLDVWKLVDRIVGARTGEPVADPALTALDPFPLSGALPEWEPPVLSPLDPATVDALVGAYEFGPGAIGRVYVHEGDPYIHVPGEGEGELFQTPDGTLTVRVEAGVTIEPRRDGSGEVTELVLRLGTVEMRARRVEEASRATSEGS